MTSPALEFLCPMALPMASADDASRQRQWQWLRALLREANLHRALRLNEPMANAPGNQAGTAPLAHEHWLARHWGLPQPDAAAALLLMAPHDPSADAGSPSRPASGQAWLLRPVHLHLGRDHLVLGHPDPQEHALPDPQAWLEVLREAMAPDWSLQFWSSASGEPFFVLHTPASLDWQPRSGLQAAGRSIEAYLPQGQDARQWRRFLNHAQMLLHEHPLNQARGRQGLVPINGLWLEGRIEQPARAAPQPLRLAALAQVLAQPGSAADNEPRHTWWIQDWIHPASLGDEAGWRCAWQAFTDILASRPPRAGSLPRQWHFFGEDSHLALESRAGDAWRLWRDSLPSAS